MKRIRMDREAYEDGSTFSVTVATAGRQAVLADASVARICVAQLEVAARKYGAQVFAYCFMPDHVHLLVSLPGGTSLVTFVRHFKQLSAYAFRRLAGHKRESLWQRRFYDHALRRDEGVHDVADYIWSNPIRAGLVEDAAHYEYSGSLVREWEAALSQRDVGEGRQALRLGGM